MKSNFRQRISPAKNFKSVQEVVSMWFSAVRNFITQSPRQRAPFEIRLNSGCGLASSIY